MKLLRSLVFHRFFLNVEFFWGTHLVHSRWNFWEVRTFIEIFLVWNFSKIYTEHIPRKPLRSLISHRYSLSVEFFSGAHLEHFRWNSWEVWTSIDIFKVRNFSEVHTWYIFDETLEKFGLSSIFSECGIFQRSILSTFWWSSWEVWSFYDIF